MGGIALARPQQESETVPPGRLGLSLPSQGSRGGRLCLPAGRRPATSPSQAPETAARLVRPAGPSPEEASAGVHLSALERGHTATASAGVGGRVGLWSSRVGRWPWAPAPRGQLGALPRPRRTHGFCFVTLTPLREQVSLRSLFREAGCSSPRPPVRNPQMGGLDDRRCPRARRLECPTRPWGGGSPEASLPAAWTASPPVSHVHVPISSCEDTVAVD